MATLDDFIPQRRNANKHTPRGMGELESSVQSDGWIGAISAAADGEVFDGSARREVIETVLGEVEPIVIDIDGTRPVILRRTDIPTATDPRAVRLGLAANKVAADNLNWDAAILDELRTENAALLDGLFRPEEVDALLADLVVPDWDTAIGALPDGDRAPFQQMTFTVTDDQATVIREALTAAKAFGPFIETGNENSNGNALARICEAYRG